MGWASGTNWVFRDEKLHLGIRIRSGESSRGNSIRLFERTDGREIVEMLLGSSRLRRVQFAEDLSQAVWRFLCEKRCAVSPKIRRRFQRLVSARLKPVPWIERIPSAFMELQGCWQELTKLLRAPCLGFIRLRGAG